MRQSIRVVLWISFVLALVTPAIAQNGPMRYQQILHVTIKPGTGPEFESIMKQYVDAAGKLGVANRWRMFQQSAGGSPNHYHIVSAFNDWATRDAWTAPRKMFVDAHGDDAYAETNRRWASVVTSTSTTVSQHDAKLSTTGAGGIRRHYVVRVDEVRPDRTADYRYALHKMRVGQQEADGSTARIGQRFIEGNNFSFKSTTGFDSGADRDRWPAFADYMSMYTQEERDQILETITGAVVSSRTYEVTLREELSYTGPSAASN